MRILAVTPIAVTDSELARRQQRYDRLAPANVSVLLHNLGTDPDVPRALENDDDVAASEEAVTAWFAAADAQNVDAFLPDCVLDPGVGPGARTQQRPVLGLMRLASGFLAATGASLGAVARNDAIAAELERKLATYGIGPLHEPVSVLNLSLAEIADDTAWSASVATALESMSAGYVLNACSAVNLTGAVNRGPVLVDPTALALQLAGLLSHQRDSIPGSVPA
ncbi:hypothetical protein [Arthrobacter gengyunqii]|uniref:Hydantoin racemase n=1 Tax=Arthrobacter gengyunqii TaxID=2886940 RepID=A0ABS8GLA3_9MICC|nr:hypothetical protein [Arthrobacter gengyunqii]MCC3266948.1 hypothetical protein [Arthrobacter gengyunqii]